MLNEFFVALRQFDPVGFRLSVLGFMTIAVGFCYFLFLLLAFSLVEHFALFNCY